MKNRFPDIKVMNHSQALEYVYSHSGNPKYQKYAIISIQEATHGYGFGLAFKTGGNCLDALNIEFSDCTPVIQLEGDLLMSRENAMEIHDFVENLPDDVELLIIHCRAGQSRSVAVAAAISLVKTGSYNDIINDESELPNKYVYCTMLEAYGRHNDYQEKYYESDKKLIESLSAKFPEGLSPEIIKIATEILNVAANLTDED